MREKNQLPSCKLTHIDMGIHSFLFGQWSTHGVAFNMLLESIHPQNQPGEFVWKWATQQNSWFIIKFPFKMTIFVKKYHPLQTHQKTVQKIWPFPACIWIFRVRLFPAFGFSLRQLWQKGMAFLSQPPEGLEELREDLQRRGGWHLRRGPPQGAWEEGDVFD